MANEVATNVEQMDRLDSYESMMDANAHLMSEVYTDSKMTAAEKMKTFSIGVRNQVMLSRDLQARRAELYRYGMKAQEVRALNFNPFEQPSAPAPAAEA